jgi:hypothetical protein
LGTSAVEDKELLSVAKDLMGFACQILVSCMLDMRWRNVRTWWLEAEHSLKTEWQNI